MNALSANMGSEVEVKPRRNGSRGRGKATAELAQEQTKADRKPPAKADPRWKLPTDRLESLGREMAEAAVKSVKDAGTLWDRARTGFVEAQEHGRGAEAVEALFHAGDETKGRKAPWYRTYKSILTSAVKLNIAVSNEMGVTALQTKIKAAKAEQADPEVKQAQLRGMFERLAKGCLNAGISRADLAKIIKEIEV